MSLDRRQILLSAAAAGLAGTIPVSARGAPAAGDAALNSYFDGLSNALLDKAPEQATYLGLDAGGRAARKSRLADASMAQVQHDRVWCASGPGQAGGLPGRRASRPAPSSTRPWSSYAMELGRDAAPFDYGDNTLSSAMSESADALCGQPAGRRLFRRARVPRQPAQDRDQGRRRGLPRPRARDRPGHGPGDRAHPPRRRPRRHRRPTSSSPTPSASSRACWPSPPAQARLVTALVRKAREKGIAGDYGPRAARRSSRTRSIRRSPHQLATLKGLQAKATHDAGVWRLPDGEAYYRWLLREGTTTDADGRTRSTRWAWSRTGPSRRAWTAC